MKGRVLTAIVVLVALGHSPAAAPHGGGGAAKGYASTITSITPPNGEIEAAILDADDRLELRVRGDHVVVIEGYEGEPYLRFSSDGVERNRRSPATYLNDDRFGGVGLPADADPEAPPEWEIVAAAGRAYDWHDHRIHWMSTSYPPVVVADKNRPHRIFDWAVPGTVDGKPFAVQGHLDYAPLPGQRFPRFLVIPLVVLVLLAATVPLLRKRRAHNGIGPLPTDVDGKDTPL
jgi:hypothetical protein